MINIAATTVIAAVLFYLIYKILENNRKTKKLIYKEAELIPFKKRKEER